MTSSRLFAWRPDRRAMMLLSCFAISLFVYWRTLAPTVYTFDSAEFVTGAYTLGIIHATGYPLYLLLGKLFTLLPFGDVAYRVNLMSAVWGAATVALVALICYRLTGRTVISATAALLYAFSHYYWPAAVVAEVYTLHTALVAVLLLLLLPSADAADQPTPARWTAPLAGLVFGLALANHMSAILVVPALVYRAWLERRRQPVRQLLLFGACLLLGLALYLYLPLRYSADPPLNYAKTYFETDLTTARGIWSWVTAEMFRAYMVSYTLPELLSETAAFVSWLWINFVGAGVVIGLVGLAVMLRRESRRAILLGLTFLAFAGFFINYRVVDKDTMFAVSYLVWTVWLAYGARSIEERLAPAQARVVPALLGALALISLVANYEWADQSQNRLARDYAGGLLRAAEPSAFIVTEWTWATPLEYLQIVEGWRPDVVIFDRGLYGLAIHSRLVSQGIPETVAFEQIEEKLAERIQAEMQNRPVYATEYDEFLARRFSFLPENRYYRLGPLPRTQQSP